MRSNGGGTSERGAFRIDQLLVERLGRDPDSVGDIGEFQLARKVEQGRLVENHRVLCPCREIFSRFSLTITRWLLTSTMQRSRTRNHTTHGDVTPVSVSTQLVTISARSFERQAESGNSKGQVRSLGVWDKSRVHVGGIRTTSGAAGPYLVPVGGSQDLFGPTPHHCWIRRGFHQKEQDNSSGTFQIERHGSDYLIEVKELRKFFPPLAVCPLE